MCLKNNNDLNDLPIYTQEIVDLMLGKEIECGPGILSLLDKHKAQRCKYGQLISDKSMERISECECHE